MEDFKSEDKVNILIGFYDDNGVMTKENLFFKKNIEINEYEDIPGVFYTEPIEDIKPVNYHGFIPVSGYSFEYSTKSGYIVQFNTGYNAMVYFSKESYFDIKKEFFNELINDCQSKINELEKEIKENKKQIDIFNNMKG